MGDMDSENELCICDMDLVPTVGRSFPESTRPCIEVWREKAEKGILSCTHFKEHWRIWVPKIYSPEPNVSCLDWSFDESKAQAVLFETLERFICDGDPREVLNGLGQLDNPPSVCGRVFKMGEPTYSCRECGMDSTCVLCVDCFKQSTHRLHKYKMGTSSGGGCCDCGDTEAWRTAPFCDIHVAGADTAHGDRSLPAELAVRARATFTAVLKYAYQLLTLEHSPGLPSDLQLREADQDPLMLGSLDTYCTVLFNDETHTFEQVINTLTRVLKCTQKDAIDFVTNIDREGRAVVKCSTFHHCNELKVEIERFTSRHGNRALRVLVVHAHVVAHQLYAMKLLDWLQRILGHAEGFRTLFSEVALATQAPDASIVEGILLRDSSLWKAARSHWHRLIISGMLMEYDSKKAFARVFAKNYGSVLQDFMRDDHDHSFSVASMSVQVFTVPTLAHHLIAHEDVLFILLNTFISECSRKLNRSGKLEFERNVSTAAFKRAQFILYDLRYLLSATPTEWTDALRKGFLQGLSLLLNLLTYMQGMDQVTRQVGQHMEYEPEWESAFNLHIKLAQVISLTLEWCGTDKVVLIKAYRATLKKLYENPCFPPGSRTEVRELADHSATCLQYDVATEPVSIHLPLSRFLSGLHLHLEKHSLNYYSPELQVAQRPTPEQLLEPVLRTLVMVSQVHAGMWRRNGYSLLNQLYFYHNVKCRSEMLDRDIVLLQVGASMIESNELMIHLLNKYNLLAWADPLFEETSLRSPEEDSMRQTISLVEEMLGTLVVLVGERHTPGVGQVSADDRIRHEIVHQLCIRPLPHSELNKTLPEDVNHETGMERVIDDVAEFRKAATPGGKGVYEPKAESLARYNVFHYHYTREELSKSEEAQRRRRKAAGELECCPPPQLPPLTEAFQMGANLLQCDVTLHMLRTVLERSLNLRARSFSETQLHKALHLIGYALQEEESCRCPFLVFTERAERWGLEGLIEELTASPRVEAHRDLLAWTLAKYRAVAAPRDTPPAPPPEPLPPQTDTASDEKEWRARMAAQKRAKIMAQMKAMQRSFMKDNAKLFEAEGMEEMPRKTEFGGSLMDLTEEPEGSPVCLGPRQTPHTPAERTYTCILCQEDQAVTAAGPALVLAAFVQQSTVLCKDRSSADDGSSGALPYIPSRLGPAPHTGTCGHVMHSHCWQKYFDNVLAKINRRPYRLRQPDSFDIEKQEFVCPLCECLSNTVLPLVPPLATLQRPRLDSVPSFEAWVRGLRLALSYKKTLTKQGEGEEEAAGGDVVQELLYTCPLDQVVTELDPEEGPRFARLFSGSPATPLLSFNLNEMLLLFVQATYTKGLGLNPHLEDPRVPLMAWKSCAYTVLSLEALLRALGKPLLGDLASRQRDCLEGLVRVVGVLGASWVRPEPVASHALSLLSVLLDSDSSCCLLDWDCFGLLVPLALSLPGLFGPGPLPTGGPLELHTLQLLLLAQVTKALLTLDLCGGEAAMDVDGETSAGSHIMELLTTVRSAAGYAVPISPQSTTVWAQVRAACTPFLRCCCLFYHFLSGVPAAPALLQVGGDTVEVMCSYLGLPDLRDLVRSPLATELATHWASKCHGRTSPSSPSPAGINQLVSLPRDYSELINTVSTFTCPNSDHDDSRNPTLCLVCGEMLCSQSYCCQTELNKSLVGACTHHAHTCGAGVGVFLRVRECEVLLLAVPKRGCFMSPPYLDQYGETDQGLRRGNPLTLCPERYRKLHLLWLGHGVHEEIARALESSSNLISTQWQHL